MWWCESMRTVCCRRGDLGSAKNRIKRGGTRINLGFDVECLAPWLHRNSEFLLLGGFGDKNM